MSALNIQVDGGHYKDLAIQPVEYIHANGIPFTEGCVIKYVTRWRTKGGIKDLEKARHFIDLLIELESRQQVDGAEESRGAEPAKQNIAPAHTEPPDTVDFRSILKEYIERALKSKIAQAQGSDGPTFHVMFVGQDDGHTD